MRESPTADTYNDKLWQSVRGLGVAAGKYDFLKTVLSVCRAFENPQLFGLESFFVLGAKLS